MILVGLDPGPVLSAFVLWNGETVLGAAELPTVEMLHEARHQWRRGPVAVELLESFGMPVGKEVFETAFVIGRLMEILGDRFVPVYRSKVKLHFCGSSRAKDGNVRASILDRFGGKLTAVGKKATPGPLYGVHGHMWSALAVAIYAMENSDDN